MSHHLPYFRPVSLPALLPHGLRQGHAPTPPAADELTPAQCLAHATKDVPDIYGGAQNFHMACYCAEVRPEEQGGFGGLRYLAGPLQQEDPLPQPLEPLHEAALRTTPTSPHLLSLPVLPP